MLIHTGRGIKRSSPGLALVVDGNVVEDVADILLDGVGGEALGQPEGEGLVRPKAPHQVLVLTLEEVVEVVVADALL